MLLLLLLLLLPQSILGGQPLLIIGVAEPIVLIYGFMYSFCSSTPGLGRALFLPWCGWVCVWTALLCLLLALSNACQGISRFTRFSGELFGALIAILFLQVGIKVCGGQHNSTAALAMKQLLQKSLVCDMLSAVQAGQRGGGLQQLFAVWCGLGAAPIQHLPSVCMLAHIGATDYWLSVPVL